MVTELDQNTALVLIDLQKGITGNPALGSNKQDVLENAARLVKAFREKSLPVVIVNVNPSKMAASKTRKEFKQPPNPAWTEDALEIDPKIPVSPGDIYITKHTWGAFYETPLDEELKKKNVTGIVLGGISTSIGVEGTARQASEKGYNITFAIDAMMDGVPESHEKSIKYIFPRMGERGTTEEIIKVLSAKF